MILRKVLATTTVAVALASPAGWPLHAGPALAVTLSVSCGTVGRELDICRQGIAAWEKKTGNDVTVIPAPNSPTERFALYRQILQSGSGDIDVFQIDVYWPGLLAPYLLNLAPFAGDAAARHFPAIIANNTIDGRLVAMPWFADVGILYFRKDLLEKHGRPVPATWQELTETARLIQRREREARPDRIWGLVFQGRAYEGLTCAALEWVASFGGGTFVAPDGEVTIDNPRAVDALTLAASWIGDITPRGTLNYAEEEARRMFQAGDAVFMRNWPYAWALVNDPESPVHGRVGVAALPGGSPDGGSTGTLGGWQLAVSGKTRHPAAAADLVRFLTGRAEQKRRAIRGSFNPTRPDLYRDPDVLAAVPFHGSLHGTFTTATARPSEVTGPRYPDVSRAIFSRVHEILSGQRSARDGLATLARDLTRIRRDGW